MADATNDPIIESKSEPDPIVDRSMSSALLISSLVLIATLGWALYDEVLGLRPWKRVQARFVDNYKKYLKMQLKPSQTDEQKIKESPEYQQLEAEVKSVEATIKTRSDEIDKENKKLDSELSIITAVMQEPRSKIAALTYELEHVSESSKKSYQSEIDEARKGPYEIKLPGVDGKVSYTRLEELFSERKRRKAELSAELTELTKPVTELRKKRDQYVQDNLASLSRQQIDGLIRKMDTFTYEIKQINVAGAELVDRCTSCHLGIREPLTLTPAGLRRVLKRQPTKSEVAAFISHPNKELLQKHDPDRFGCSPCHGGNGRATSSTDKAHGLNKHWLWPLYEKKNIEAGCQQCHAKDLVLAGAEVLNQGKELYQEKGCVGCHRYEGFDRETDSLFNARLTTSSLEKDREAKLREITRTSKAADTAKSNEEAQSLNAQVNSLRVRISQIDSKLDELRIQTKHLMQDQKKIGPNLKEIRYKLRKEWIPVWLKDNFDFRPTTKMPRFRLMPDEIEAISAFIWQSALQGDQLVQQSQGDATKGKEAFETRGCLACHSIGEDKNIQGNDFAANLSRLGEKANYDYIVRWVHNPRERTRPYCPKEKRDIGPEDYAKKGLPYTFDLGNSRCPNDGTELQVQQMTVMPSLRLSDQESRDIASYLMTLKRNGAQYPSAEQVAFMDDQKLKSKGLALVKNYGCASCHEISGLEEEARIGTELTDEGVKPIERLDFGLLEHDFKKEGKYKHKYFFENKIDDPAIFDKGKEKAPQDRLKMPEPNMNKDEINALTTFLLGSVGKTASIPSPYFYTPTDQRRDIQEGWWVIKKYNCVGCHNVAAGQLSGLQLNVPRYQDPDWKEQLPPPITTEGARVDPNWLMRFLSDPSLANKLNQAAGAAAAATPVNGANGTNGAKPATAAPLKAVGADRNGVRPYLVARMPTFNFSPNELRVLVKFFEAVSAQSQPYIPTQLEVLSEQERTLARQLFTSPGAPCLKCHITDDRETKGKNAPNFLIAGERLKPGWTGRWLIDPQLISPGTAMPSNLFKHEGERWVFNGTLPAGFNAYTKDHVDLLVRYMFQFTPEEQRRLAGSGGGAATGPRPPQPPNLSSRNRYRPEQMIVRSRGIAVTH
ncbi:MAG: c-type cytochrome [Acidobacteriota bacterium]